MKPLFLFTLLFFISCSSDKKTEEGIVARVGDETLTKKDLLFLVGSRAGDLDAFSRAISKWVENKLLYRAALSIGLDKDIALNNQRDLFYENLMISSFIKIQTKKRTKNTKKEVSAYYLKNKDSFKRIDDEVIVKHFTFSTNKAAKKLKKELKKKKPGVDMEIFLNKQRVKTKTIRKKDAGSNHVGFVFNGAVGDILGPKEHNKSFHVFQILQKHKKGSYFGLEKVYDEIYQRIYKEKEILILGRVLDSLYLSSDVFVSQEVLNQ
tara:strand:+ start:52 stop:846 length:795 start_codon:yes stop_codon:yes gene_type:complete